MQRGADGEPTARGRKRASRKCFGSRQDMRERRASPSGRYTSLLRVGTKKNTATALRPGRRAWRRYHAEDLGAARSPCEEVMARTASGKGNDNRHEREAQRRTASSHTPRYTRMNDWTARSFVPRTMSRRPARSRASSTGNWKEIEGEDGGK